MHSFTALHKIYEVHQRTAQLMACYKNSPLKTSYWYSGESETTGGFLFLLSLSTDVISSADANQILIWKHS